MAIKEKKDIELRFEEGTLVVIGPDAHAPIPEPLVYDPRVARWRAPAHAYRALLTILIRAGYKVEDNARGYEELAQAAIIDPPDPYPHQRDAIEAWVAAGRRGVVVLPTGAGKTYVAQLAIQHVQRTALVIVPTIDLLHQWSTVLQRAFGQEIGLIGGGYHELRPITVSTYDSACIHMDRLGHRFGLLIFDEVHHLPGELYRQAALSSIAPFRLGLTATYERADGKHTVLDELVGPVTFQRSIKELAGDVLATYEVRTVSVQMTQKDLESYNKHREIYRTFLRSHNISMSSPSGWQRFLAATSKSPYGREALDAYHQQKQLALVHQNKLDKIDEILNENKDARIIIFTNDNASVYEISHRYLCPTITHQTPVKERKEVLARFNEGVYSMIVTSKVLNEGVDVPEANVAIILSGSGSIREHVQRLGRILRRREGKQAKLYELVTENTVETYVSQRRREHDAYQ
jgi:superfamily II DNA or RNA helicase